MLENRLTTISVPSTYHHCLRCGDDVNPARWVITKLCLFCGEEAARAERASWCIAPMHKSNYMLITDRRDLHGLNNKGGLIR
jgi:RNA polymerase-binding transcription factor DksA